MNLYVTQVKRELWENKVSFIYTPAIISILIIAMIIFSSLYVKGVVDGKNGHFNFTFNNTQQQAGVSVPSAEQINANPTMDANSEANADLKSSIMKDPSAFNGIVLGVMYTNCAMLYLVFSVVMSAYSLRCLFDDRKNKDILFWRSMPVSETTNVVVKLGMVMLVGPLIMLLLNLIVTLVIFLFGLVFFGVHGIELSYLISSILNGGAFYIPLQIFYELFFSLLMSLPIIGFAFWASAFAKKTPFFIFVIPVILALVDKILASAFGLNIGVIDVLSIYGHALANVSAAFILQQLFVFNQTMIFPLIMCIAVGALFIAGAIWLRNNRYEI